MNNFLTRGVFLSPASSANLGPGYDVFALALAKPNLRLSIEISDGTGTSIEVEGRYRDEIPRDPNINAAAKAAKIVLQTYRIEKEVHLKLDASIPPRKGLGASGAEAAAAVYGLNELLNLRLTRDEMVFLAAKAEPGEHLDNVSASIHGGFVICLRDVLGYRTATLPPPPGLGLIIIMPNVFKESTAAARKAVPETVSITEQVEIAAKTAATAAAIATGDVGLFLRAVLLDPVVERRRAETGVYGKVNWDALFEEKKLLYQRYGVSEVISGAGPSRLLLFDKRLDKAEMGKRKVDEAVATVVANIEKTGVKVLEIIETEPDVFGCRKID